MVQEHSPSSNVGFKSRSVDAICGLSLLLVLFFAPRGFSCFPRPHNPTESNFFFQFHQYWLLVIQSLLHSPLSFMQCESSSKTTRHSKQTRLTVKSSLSKRSQFVLLVHLFMKWSLYIIESTSLPLCEMIVNTTMLKNTLK